LWKASGALPISDGESQYENVMTKIGGFQKVRWAHQP
jgi:hypothetical protein